jgi:hypothetical protein
MFQASRKGVDLQPGGRNRLLPVAPSPCRRHLERRDASLRLRCRDHRRGAPGRRRRRALQPSPQQRGAADQRDDACKNSRKIHEAPLSIARTRIRWQTNSDPIADLEIYQQLGNIHELLASKPSANLAQRPALSRPLSGRYRDSRITFSQRSLVHVLAQGSRRWTLQQVGRYLGYTCRGDRAVEKTARDPKLLFERRGSGSGGLDASRNDGCHCGFALAG